MFDRGRSLSMLRPVGVGMQSQVGGGHLSIIGNGRVDDRRTLGRKTRWWI